MKKFIAVLLSVLMIFSSFGVVSFAAGEQIDVENALAKGELDDVNVLGMSVDFLYNSTDEIFWKNIACSRDQITLAEGNLNSYLKFLLKDMIGDKKLYTEENAVWLINIIGHIINPSFQDVTVCFDDVTPDKYVDKTAFYKSVAKKSGLTTRIQYNWCSGRYVDYKNFMIALGVNFDKILVDEEYKDGELMATMLLEAVFENILSQGPLDYFFGILSRFAKTYDSLVYPVLVAFFNGQWTNDNVPIEEQLKNMNGLFNLISERVVKNGESPMYFVTMPMYRFATGDTSNELFLYFIVYCRLLGMEQKNAEPINRILADINSSSKLNATAKERFTLLIQAFFLGENVAEAMKMIATLQMETITNSVNDLKDQAKNGWFTMLSSFINNFIKFLDRIYQSFIHFGDFFDPDKAK